MRLITKMSNTCKTTIVEEFGLTDSEISQIEKFVGKQGGKTVKEILDNIIKDGNLNDKQKIIISYIIGKNSAGHDAEKTENMIMDIPNVLHFGG